MADSRRIRLREASVLKSLGTVGAARLAGLIVSFVCTVANVRILTDAIGPDGFGAVSLIATLTALIPFADLGLGIAITNLTVDEVHGDGKNLRKGVSAAIWILVAVGVVLIGASLVVSSLNAWTLLLGSASLVLGDPNFYMPLFAGLFAIWLLTGPAYRVLFGLGAAALVSILQGVTSIVAIALTLLLINSDTPIFLLAFSPLAASVLVSILAIEISRSRLQVGRAYILSPIATGKGSFQAILHVGLAGMVFSTGAVLILQSDRLLLSLHGELQALAIYSATIPMYFAAQSFASAMGGFLWPHYRKLIVQGTLSFGTLRRHIGFSTLFGLLAGSGLIVLSPLYFQIVGYTDAAPAILVYGIAVLIALQFATLPATSVLTTPRWIRAQGIVVVIAAAIKIATAWMLIPYLGAAGGVVASALAIGLVQLPCVTWMSLRAARTGSLDTAVRLRQGERTTT